MKISNCSNNNKKNNVSWLITGGCGFIGKSLISKLLSEYKDVQIRVLDNLSVGSPEDLSSVCNFSEVSMDCIDDGSQKPS